MLNKLKFLFPLAIGFFAAWAYFAPVQEEHDHDHDHDHEHEHEEKVALSEEEIRENQIETVKVGKSSVRPALVVRGKVDFHPDRVAHVLPQIQGVVVEVYKNRGDRVQAGELLALFESEEIAESKAQYLKMKEQAKLATAIAERQEQLFEKNLTSKANLEVALADKEQAKVDERLAKQKLMTYGIEDDEEEFKELRYFRLKAPIKGEVVDRHLTKGEFVEAMTPVFRIADPSLLLVEMSLPASQKKEVKKGQVAYVQFPCEESQYPAQIVYVVPYIDEEAISARAIAEVQNLHEQHCPGQFVKVSLPLVEKKDVLVVPLSALQDMDGEKVVFVKEDGGIAKRAVSIGIEDQEKAEIIAGLSPGEEVVSRGSFLIKADLGKHSLEHED